MLRFSRRFALLAHTDDNVAGDHLGLESLVGDHAGIESLGSDYAGLESLGSHLLQETRYPPEYLGLPFL